jgi:hypothetical protein
MKITTVPQDYIIMVPNEGHGKKESNFLLHGLCLKNSDNKDIIIKEIKFMLLAGESIIKEISYREDALIYQIERFERECGWLGNGAGAELFLGREGFFHSESYSKSCTLRPGEETGIFNEYFVIVHQELITKVRIRVCYREEECENWEETELAIVTYENKNNYIFPLTGAISTCGNHTCLLDHRQHFSMEFAVDMAQYNKEQKLFFKEDMKEEDHVIYGKEILAIADGIVRECYSEYPFTSSWDWEKRKPYFEKYGLASQFGNYVIVEHAHGESSFYGHMIMDSLTVQVGEQVKQGQVIGKVGHTGMSNCPHLHFQLMDKPDVLKGRGLPCSFTNVNSVAGDPIEVISEDNIIVHTI